MGFKALYSKLFLIFDRVLGRGSYPVLRRTLDPHWEYTQVTYGRMLESLLNQSSRWLDAGCGHETLKHGAGTEVFDFSTKYKVQVGCDLDLASLAEARQLVNRVCCSIEQLPFPSRTFNVVSMNNVAEHVANPAKVFKELVLVMSDDGFLIIHTPNIRSYWVTIGRVARALLPDRLLTRFISFTEQREEADLFPTFYLANSRRRLLELAMQSGLKVESILLLRARPLFYFIAPLAAIEILFSRGLAKLGLREVASPVLLGVFRPADCSSKS